MSKNVEWNRIPRDAKVIDTGKVFVAIIKGVRHVANWSSFNATEAQQSLARRAKASMKAKGVKS